MKGVIRQLTDQIGSPTTAQALLIQSGRVEGDAVALAQLSSSWMVRHRPRAAIITRWRGSTACASISWPSALSAASARSSI